MFEVETARSLLDQLLTESRLYTKSADYKALLDFTVRLRNFAPFNAMLLQVQKPGLSYAASAHDWQERFGRTIKPKARPLLILWPFTPVVLVYDVADTEGKDLPQDVSSFFALGAIDGLTLERFALLLRKKGIHWIRLDAGDKKAGSIQAKCRSTDAKTAGRYEMHVNRNHSTNVQFSTLAHELGHLFLGHLGPDKFLKVPERERPDHAQRELEAESVAYIVCSRNGVQCRSQTYLANFVEAGTTIDDVDIYQVMRAAGQIESLLELSAPTKYDRHPIPKAVA